MSLQAENLGKAYRIYARPIDSLKEWMLRRSYGESFWALHGVDFELPKGSSLGVIGENGAGKSTLLKLLAGTISPTRGRIARDGSVSAILELGSGFHPDLSGIENVRIGCATIGLSAAETEEKVPEIIEFSELKDFINRPVKTYSTGMYARLAFSVATAVDPDILIVDEVLSVGDEHFRKKSIDFMMNFARQGKTVVYCSHMLGSVRQVSDRCLWLRQGRLEALDRVETVIDAYQKYVRSLDGAEDPPPGAVQPERPRYKRAGVESSIVSVSLDGDLRDGVIETGKTLRVRLVVRLGSKVVSDGVGVAVAFIRSDNVYCHAVNSFVDGAQLFPLSGEERGISLVVPELPLLTGEYTLLVSLCHANNVHFYDYWRGVAPFKVTHRTNGEQGVVRMKYRWEQP
jgi:lipopolysaccharide transport system ATP-binding protein